MNKKREITGAVYIIISAILFGIMPLFAKVAFQHGSNAYTVAFGRFGFGCVILFAIILISPKHSILVTRKELLHILGLSFAYALTPLLLYTSYQYIDSGLATTLHFTYPISVIIILALFFHRKPDKKQIICTIICMVGVLMFYRPGSQINMFGVLVAIASGIIYSIYIVFLDKGTLKSMSALTLSFWISFFASLEIGFVAILTDNFAYNIDLIGWSMEILLALFATVIALMLFQKGLFLCGEVKSSLLSTFEPITGLVIGIIVFKEKLMWQDIIGLLLVLTAVILLVLGKNKH